MERTMVIKKNQIQKSNIKCKVLATYKSFDYTDDNLSLVTQGVKSQPKKIKNLIKIGCES